MSTNDLRPVAAQNFRWRRMQAADLDAVLGIAARVHPDYPEDAAIFAERLALYPQGCFVLQSESGLGGYAISHPWREGQPPRLNTRLGELPQKPTTYYWHDVAIEAQARGCGAGSAITGLLAEHARSSGFTCMSLVAVGPSASYWRRHGFEVLANPALAAQLASYDASACFMVRCL